MMQAQAGMIETQNVRDFVSSLGLSVRAVNVLLQAGLTSPAQLFALDERSLRARRTCGKKTAAEIMRMTRRLMVDDVCQTASVAAPSSARATEKLNPVEVWQKTPAASAFAAALNAMPLGELHLSVRARHALDRLQISTVGQLIRLPEHELLKLQNVGAKTLCELRSKLARLRSGDVVLWPVDPSRKRRLNPRLTAAAGELHRLPDARQLRNDDIRFGHLIRRLGVDAANAAEAADRIVSRKVDPLDPAPLQRHLAELIRVISTGATTPLEQELWSLTEGLGSRRDRRIIISHLGWDGKPARTLEAVGQRHGMTRERVRQICTRIEPALSSKPFLPVLDRALETVLQAAPCFAEAIERKLLQAGYTKEGFSIQALLGTARRFGRQPNLFIETFGGQCFVVPGGHEGLLNGIKKAAYVAVTHRGVASIADVAEAAKADLSLLQRMLPLLPGFKWLDQTTGCFWMADAPRNPLVRQIRKILAACGSAELSELRAGIGRHLRRKDLMPAPDVLLELCSQLSWCRVQGSKIRASAPLNPYKVLNQSEQVFWNILKRHGPVLQRQKLAKFCFDAGMNQHTFDIVSTCCPFICRHGIGIYGLLGYEVPPDLIKKPLPKPKRPTRPKVLLNHAWIDDQKLQMLYRTSPGLRSCGMINLPPALKPFLQGRFTLITEGNSPAGTLVVKGANAWGLLPFFTKRREEPGPFLLLLFDLSKREVMAQIGDLAIADRSGPPTSVPAPALVT